MEGSSSLAEGLTLADQQRDYFLGVLVGEPSCRVWAYRKVAWAIKDTPQDVVRPTRWFGRMKGRF